VITVLDSAVAFDYAGDSWGTWMRLGKGEWDRWAGWIEKVRKDLQSTVNDHAVFEVFRNLVIENSDWIDEHEGGLFVDFVARSYVAKVALGIRRHVKNDDTVSLMRVLCQMKACAPQLTFDFYLERFPRDPEYVPWQEPTFGLVSDDGVIASAERIGADIAELEHLTADVEAFVDRQYPPGQLHRDLSVWGCKTPRTAEGGADATSETCDGGGVVGAGCSVEDERAARA
jgi:hypothetical protein